jgi:hypothetical protein
MQSRRRSPQNARVTIFQAHRQAIIADIGTVNADVKSINAKKIYKKNKFTQKKSGARVYRRNSISI